jgi:hypothetical protein
MFINKPYLKGRNVAIKWIKKISMKVRVEPKQYTYSYSIHSQKGGRL